MEIATRLAAKTLEWIPRKRISRMMGRAADLRPPRAMLEPAVAAFIRAYGVDLADAIVPAGGFASFDAFFTRPLRPGARPVDTSPGVIVSPSDGRVDDVGAIDDRAAFAVKGMSYDVAELVGSSELASALRGGTFVVVYLAPPDYHRVHAAIDGAIVELRHIEGTLYPVNAIGTRYVPRLFARNERVVVVQRDGLGGTFATVLVGAMGVGRISLTFDDLQTNTDGAPRTRTFGAGGPALARGDEVGAFHLGSTVVLLASRRLDPIARPGDRVRVGGPLLHESRRE